MLLYWRDNVCATQHSWHMGRLGDQGNLPFFKGTASLNRLVCMCMFKGTCHQNLQSVPLIRNEPRRELGKERILWASKPNKKRIKGL